ncbi:MAG: hypothetical protein HGA90_05240, partial [Alphaproteobacteria bacterium]|nr:hypothetical protein [Alphaproteobacteria bacterium]
MREAVNVAPWTPDKPSIQWQKAKARSQLRQFIENELTEASLADYVPYLRQELRERGGLLLLDGLDE